MSKKSKPKSETKPVVAPRVIKQPQAVIVKNHKVKKD